MPRCNVQSADLAIAAPPDATTERRLLDWLSEYVTRPHPELGRHGPICPFVRPALASGALVIRYAEWNPAYHSRDLERIVEWAVTQFRTMEWPEHTNHLHALLVAIPTLGSDQWKLIDEVHARVKDQIVAQGLMIGQFHPECPAPAAHNPDFPVNRAPLPILVIREMSQHDVLFLGEKADWLRSYLDRFDSSHAAARIEQLRPVGGVPNVAGRGGEA